MSKLKVMLEKSRKIIFPKSNQFLRFQHQDQILPIFAKKLDFHNRFASDKHPKRTGVFFNNRFSYFSKPITFAQSPLFQSNKRFIHSESNKKIIDEMEIAAKIIEESFLEEDFDKLDELNKLSMGDLLLTALDEKQKLDEFTKNGELPLHIVIKKIADSHWNNKNLETLETLLRFRFCDPNKKNKKGETALFVPIQSKNYQKDKIYRIVKKLIEHGANPDIVNDKGQTPAHVYFEALDLAPFDRDIHIERILRLMLKNMSLEKIDNKGWSLLHLAVYKQRMEFVSFLLENDADPNIATTNGITPFDLAVFKRNEKICKLLKQFGGKEPNKYKFELKEEYEDDYITEKYKPTFFSDIITKISNKLKFKFWHYFGSYYYSGPWDQETGLFLPQNKDHSLRFYLCNSEKLRKECYDIVTGINTEVALRSIYWPEKEEGDLQLYLTPMGKAILQKDLKKVEKLILEGWNAFIENDFIRGTAYINKYYYEEASWYRMVKYAKVKGYAKCILECIKTVPTEFNNHLEIECDESFAQSVLKMLCGSEHSGINLVNEFYNAIHSFERTGDVNDQYAYFLMRNGLTPKTFRDQTGLIMTEFLESEFNSVQEDDRPPFYHNGHYKISDLIRFIETIDNKHNKYASELTEAIKKVKPK